MKIAHLVAFGLMLLSSLPAEPDSENDDFGISSTRDIDILAGQLGNSGEQIQALTKLIKFAGPQIGGSVTLVTQNPKRDKLCRYAASALGTHHEQSLFLLALKEPDEKVRSWGVGVMSSELFYGRTKPWEPFLPLLENIALHDVSENIRSLAIERLQYCDKEQPFLKELRTSTKEDSPRVLMHIYDFSSTNLELKNGFYARAVQFLSSPNEAQRMKWLHFIYFNVWNPSTAPMWRLEANETLVKELSEITASGSPQERIIAQKTLILWKKAP